MAEMMCVSPFYLWKVNRNNLNQKKRKRRKRESAAVIKKKKANAVTIARILCDFFMVKFYFKFVFFFLFFVRAFHFSLKKFKKKTKQNPWNGQPQTVVLLLFCFFFEKLILIRLSLSPISLCDLSN
jgi:quinol-cytochrome oxidoreductase complex cytochrome b subunit